MALLPRVNTTLECVIAQEVFWPGSRIMLWEDFVNECQLRIPIGSNIDWEERVERYRIAYPNAVPYETAGKHRYLGIRYGIHGSEYISGFPEAR